ncbi:MAG: hypothetical protein JWP63_1800 [Candidatus Solibacter sp.]|nr:hypothetical protein [Candidatus Solibacter sp.]
MRTNILRLAMMTGLALPAAGGVVLPPNLGSASTFGLLGGTISNTGVSVVTGNVGAQTTVTGFPPGTATGTVYPAPSDPTVAAAYLDFLAAFNYGNTVGSTQTLDDLTMNRTILGNSVTTFLVTDVTSTANINLTFDAQADSSEVFIVRIAHDLQINGPMTFSLINGATASNIYWIIGRDGTISSGGGPTNWEGNILAGRNFTMAAIPGGSETLTGVIDGCVFAESANTLAGRTNIGGCVASTQSSIPEPGTAGLLAAGGLCGAWGLRRRTRHRSL